MGYRRRQPPDTVQSDRIKSWPADERPREKLLVHGAESLSPAELVAVVLRVGQGSFQKGVPGQNATAFAKQLLNHFGGIEGLGRAHVEELSAIHGLGPAKVAQIKAAIELGKRASAGKLTLEAFPSSDDGVELFKVEFATRCAALKWDGAHDECRKRWPSVSRLLIGSGRNGRLELQPLLHNRKPLREQE